MQYTSNHRPFIKILTNKYIIIYRKNICENLNFSKLMICIKKKEKR